MGERCVAGREWADQHLALALPLSAPTGRYIVGPWGAFDAPTGPPGDWAAAAGWLVLWAAWLGLVGVDGGTRGGYSVGCGRVVACFRGLGMGEGARHFADQWALVRRGAPRRKVLGNCRARLPSRARCVTGGPSQVTACPTAREGAGVESALTCRNALLGPDPAIWHPVPSIVHPVSEGGAVGAWSPSAHVLRTVTTVAGSDQIDVRFISRCSVQAGRTQ